MSLSPGTRIGQFEIAELVGVGGVGEVHRKSAKTLDLRAFFMIWAIEPPRMLMKIYGKFPDRIFRELHPLARRKCHL